jgi:hypothetical protein
MRYTKKLKLAVGKDYLSGTEGREKSRNVLE